MMNKKGSHVEVIIAFIIFVTFLVATYTIMKPAIINPIEQQYLLNHIEEMIKNESSASLTIQKIKGNLDDNPCIELKTQDYLEDNIFVKDEYDADAEICNTGNGYAITPTESTIIGERVLKIYYSKEQFKPNPNIGYCPSEDCFKDYDLEQKTTKYIFKEKIKKLQSDSAPEIDYGLLKDQFGVPDGKDFEFSFKETSTNIIKDDDKGVNVYAKEIPILYVDNGDGKTDTGDGNIKTGFLNVKVW